MRGKLEGWAQSEDILANEGEVRLDLAILRLRLSSFRKALRKSITFVTLRSNPPIFQKPKKNKAFEGQY